LHFPFLQFFFPCIFRSFIFPFLAISVPHTLFPCISRVPQLRTLLWYSSCWFSSSLEFCGSWSHGNVVIIQSIRKTVNINYFSVLSMQRTTSYDKHSSVDFILIKN
jgi:hypothetical protein